MSVEEWQRDEPPAPVPDLTRLRLLAADAGGRAAAMLAGACPAAEADDPLIDAVRILATAQGAPHAARAARLTGLPEEELRQLMLAYRHGGAGGVSAAVGASAAEPDQMADAVREVRKQRALAIGELAVSTGTIADPGAGARIRLGPDGRWYPFTHAQDRWWPAPGPAESPGTAWQAALRARAIRR
ncbi:MAG: hypothetical protein ACRDOL_30675 [Streptosporangiaceae bacterium]